MTFGIINKENTIYMDLKDIIIPDKFRQTPPKDYKVDECKNWWRKRSAQLKSIVIDENGVLLDGFSQYLAFEQEGVKEKIEVRVFGEQDNVYIWGRHSSRHNKGKEYVWKLPSSWIYDGRADALDPGDKLLVRTKNGFSTIIVTRTDKFNSEIRADAINYVVKKIANLDYKQAVIRYDGDLAKMLGYI